MAGVQLMCCCLCGEVIPVNPSGTCEGCLRKQVDLTANIERNLVLPHCRHCGRYNRPPWTACEWESDLLQAVCLKKIKGLQDPKNSNAKLINSQFVFTEPHSRRIKLKLTLQQKITPEIAVEQDCVVEFVLQGTQCDDCRKAFTAHSWAAVVQVRQHVEHKHSLLLLEQIILKHQAHKQVLRIVGARDGYDFQFASFNAAQNLAEFISSQMPTRIKKANQLVSHDPKSNTATVKHAFSVEVCPLCKDDLVYIEPRIAKCHYGGVSPFMLVKRVGSEIQLVDPFSGRQFNVAAKTYWKYPFQPILTRRHQCEFVVLNVESERNQNELQRSVAMEDDVISTSTYYRKAEQCLVEVEIARLSDFGSNDTRCITKSHLGLQLRPGSVYCGYDLQKVNLSGADDLAGLQEKVPYEVILVRKARKQPTVESTGRAWVLRRLPVEPGEGKAKNNPLHDSEGVEQFKRDLEDDVDLRREVQIFKHPKASKEDLESSTVTMLEGLTIEDHVYD